MSEPVHRWRRSSKCNDSGHCVEVASLSDGGVAIRDSVRPEGPKIMVSSADWAAFTAVLRAVRLNGEG
ncbi:DUF397 domain-containing protein [Actinomadura soli]|uniref:DUF397 domain-containing protein n=1 Tax=Actinomadura soli TaxID=2508997 RepID=A0A5C4J135_9ACTN|nr:DUF397 domain-containing protein [Actinomadura soli]TMQ90211.1 DUF397 domain-containing protein [Actinomadura soli]